MCANRKFNNVMMIRTAAIFTKICQVKNRCFIQLLPTFESFFATKFYYIKELKQFHAILFYIEDRSMRYMFSVQKEVIIKMISEPKRTPDQ